jgi:hypothetical protein
VLEDWAKTVNTVSRTVIGIEPMVSEVTGFYASSRTLSENWTGLEL